MYLCTVKKIQFCQNRKQSFLRNPIFPMSFIYYESKYQHYLVLSWSKLETFF